MAEKISFSVNLAELASYSGIVDGIGSSALLKMDGFYKLLVTKVTPGKSKEGNPKFILSCVVQDEDEKGNTLVADVLAGGYDKNGKPNIHRLGNFFESIGMSVQQVIAMAQNGEQAEVTIAASMTNKVIHANVEAETYQGNTRSNVRGFITATKYTDAVSANAHRKPHKAQTSFTGTPAGVTTPAAGFALPNAAPATTPAGNKVADPLARLQGLNLPV